jgi:hypothetical protein
MKIKAIIAHRNELPANLHRTYYHIRAHGIGVDLVEDLPAMGCGYRRHQAILNTDADAVLICDAHMKFSEGYFETVRDHLKANPQDVTVSRMQSLGHDWQSIPGQRYAGAEIRLRDEYGGQYVPISAKWREQDAGDGPVGAVMGACYGMTVDHYRAMGCPLGILRAWGGDEEMLSIASWMSGGRVYLVPGLAMHVYAAPRRHEASLSHEETVRIWANRLAMLSAIPMGDGLRAELVAWLKRTAFVAQYGSEINAEVANRAADIERVFEALDGAAGMTFEDYLSKWQRTGPITSNERTYMAKTIQSDKKRRSAKQTVATTTTTTRTYTPNIRVIERPTPCPHCGHGFDHRVKHTYPNENRRVLCGKCDLPFIIFRNGSLIDRAKEHIRDAMN